MTAPDPEHLDDDDPELGDDFFARAKPARDVMPADFVAATRKKGGRPESDAPKIAG